MVKIGKNFIKKIGKILKIKKLIVCSGLLKNMGNMMEK